MRMFFEKCYCFYLRFRKIMLPLHNVKSGLHFLRRMNNMTDSIRHSGIVDSVGDDCVRVRILQTSACASCKVAGYCNASESKEKVIDVYGTAYAATVKVGDHVVVTASREVAFKALLWAFGVPFIYWWPCSLLWWRPLPTRPSGRYRAWQRWHLIILCFTSCVAGCAAR